MSWSHPRGIAPLLACSACAPLIFGYANYAADGFRARRILFADIPALGSHGPVGSVLGGTGIAVSALRGSVRKWRQGSTWLGATRVR